MRNLDNTARVNTNVIANLFSIVRDFVIRSHGMFGDMTRDIFWLNVTIHSQSKIYMAVRQLEFSLLQLILQVDELIGAIQCILGGRLPMTLVNPWFFTKYYEMCLQLPENHELIAGIKWSNMCYYYEVFKATVVGNTHGMKIILNMPLKSVNQHFILYKLIVMPKRVSEDKFIKYLPEFCYFGLSVSRRDYILLTAADLMQCPTGTITVCPSNTAL